MRNPVVAATLLGAVLIAASIFGHQLSPFKKQTIKGKHSISGMKWTDCEGTGSKYFTISSINIDGDFEIGSTATFQINGNVNQAFTHGYNAISAKYSILPIYDGTVAINPPQAYAVGPATMKSSSKVDQEPKSGGYTMVIRIQDPNHTKLQCISLTYKLS